MKQLWNLDEVEAGAGAETEKVGETRAEEVGEVGVKKGQRSLPPLTSL